MAKNKTSIIAVCFLYLFYLGSSQAQQGMGSEKELRDTVTLWATAWSSQNPEQYLNFYEEDYYPPIFSSRRDWIEDRIRRIENPDSIRIRLFDFDLVSYGDGLATVRFMLIYERPGYGDQTLKELDLIQRNGEWRINRESNLSVELLN